MKPLFKVAIIAGGHLLAFLIAVAAVAFHSALASESGGHASDGMSAFGDLCFSSPFSEPLPWRPRARRFYFLLSKKRMPKQAIPPIASTE